MGVSTTAAARGPAEMIASGKYALSQLTSMMTVTPLIRLTVQLNGRLCAIHVEASYTIGNVKDVRCEVTGLFASWQCLVCAGKPL